MIVEALDHLGVRECLLGGYISVMTPFYERSSSNQPAPAPISVLMFTATEANELFLGPAESMDALAAQIISCRGPCGHNIQYVTRLANYMREHVPEEKDPHLYGLVARIEKQLHERGLDMDALIEDAATIHPTPVNSVCAKCNALCSEYAFCNNCRTDAIKEALTCGEVPTKKTTSDSQKNDTMKSHSHAKDTLKLNSEVSLSKDKPTSPVVSRRKRVPSLRELSDRRTEIAVASQ